MAEGAGGGIAVFTDRSSGGFFRKAPAAMEIAIAYGGMSSSAYSGGRALRFPLGGKHEISFHFAPYQADWRKAGIPVLSDAISQPLLVTQESPAQDTAASLVTVQPEDAAMITAVARHKDKLTIRLWRPYDADADVTINVNGASKLERTDLLDRRPEPVSGNTIRMHRNQIVTLCALDEQTRTRTKRNEMKTPTPDSTIRCHRCVLLILACLLTGAAALADDPGRPKIVNNSLFAANGQKLRGDTLFITDTTRNNRGDEFTLTAQAWSENAHLGFNVRRLWASGGTEPTDAAKLAKLDQCVDLAARARQYVIIVYGPSSTKPIGSVNHREFWDTIAPRYKNRTHVIYELANEPHEPWPISDEETDALTGGIPMANRVRKLAPDTPIILFSLARTPRAPWYYQKFQEGYQAKYGVGWSWANALVGFHGYYLASAAQMKAVQDKWPCVNTETPTYYRGDGEKTVFGQYVYAIEDNWDQIVIMEELGIAWINFDHCTRIPYGEPAPAPWLRWIFRDFYTGFFADYLVKKNQAWWTKGSVAALTAPDHCATFTAPAAVRLTAFATDNSGTISKVEFYSGASKLGETMAAPYAFTWNGVGVGTYALTAKAINKAGASYTSYPISVSVLADGLSKATIAAATFGGKQKGNDIEKSLNADARKKLANDGMLAADLAKRGEDKCHRRRPEASPHQGKHVRREDQYALDE